MEWPLSRTSLLMPCETGAFAPQPCRARQSHRRFPSRSFSRHRLPHLSKTSSIKTLNLRLLLLTSIIPPCTFPPGLLNPEGPMLKRTVVTAVAVLALTLAVVAYADNLIIGSGNLDSGRFTFERRSDTGALVLTGNLDTSRSGHSAVKLTNGSIMTLGPKRLLLPVRFTGVELECTDSCAPVKPPGGLVVFLRIPERAVVVRVRRHTAVIAPALE